MFASSSVLLFSSHPGRLQAETPLNELCRLAEPPLPAKVISELTPLGDGDGRPVLNGLAADFCRDRSPKKGSVMTREGCAGVDDLRRASEVISQIDKNKPGSSTTMYEYRVSNPGDRVARSIKLSGDKVTFVEAYTTSGKKVEIRKDEARGEYLIPDMSPGDAFKILVWSPTPDYDYRSFYDFEELPRISFDGGIAAQSVFVHTPKIYYDIFDALNSTWWPLAVVMAIVACSVVTVVSILIITIIIAMLTGQSLSSVFNSPSPSTKPALSNTESK